MLSARDFVPRVDARGWASAADHAEHEGVSLSLEWLGLVVQLDLGRLTRTFPERPADVAPAGPSDPDAPAAAPAGVSTLRPVGLRSGRQSPGSGA